MEINVTSKVNGAGKEITRGYNDTTAPSLAAFGNSPFDGFAAIMIATCYRPICYNIEIALGKNGRLYTCQNRGNTLPTVIGRTE
jgi:hypothetical protein